MVGIFHCQVNLPKGTPRIPQGSQYQQESLRMQIWIVTSSCSEKIQHDEPFAYSGSCGAPWKLLVIPSGVGKTASWWVDGMANDHEAVGDDTTTGFFLFPCKTIFLALVVPFQCLKCVATLKFLSSWSANAHQRANIILHHPQSLTTTANPLVAQIRLSSSLNHEPVDHYSPWVTTTFDMNGCYWLFVIIDQSVVNHHD